MLKGLYIYKRKGTPIQGEGGGAREGEIMEVYNGKGNFVVLALPTDRQTEGQADTKIKCKSLL